MYEDYFNNGEQDRYGPAIEREDCSTLDALVEKYAEEMWQPEDQEIDKEELKSTLEKIMEDREQRKPRYVTTAGTRYRYLLADCVGTPFGLGNSPEEAIKNAVDCEAQYLDENSEWQTATLEWVKERLADDNPDTALYIEDAEDAFFSDESPTDLYTGI